MKKLGGGGRRREEKRPISIKINKKKRTKAVKDGSVSNFLPKFTTKKNIFFGKRKHQFAQKQIENGDEEMGEEGEVS